MKWLTALFFTIMWTSFIIHTAALFYEFLRNSDSQQWAWWFIITAHALVIGAFCYKLSRDQ